MLSAPLDRHRVGVETVRRRLTAVQTEIRNLVEVLKQTGANGLASVQEELKRSEAERKQLREQLQQLTEQGAPLANKTVAARHFLESWEGISDLLQQATLDEQRMILQHFVEVVEIGFDAAERKTGRCALRLFPEARPLDPSEGARNAERPLPKGVATIPC